MSMSLPRRREACLHFIRNGFDADQTIKWVLKEYADDENVQRAKYPERLARNIITMGAGGDQKEMNIAAFGQAFEIFVREERDREVTKTRSRIADLERDLKVANDRWADAQSEVNDRDRRIHDLQGKVENLTNLNHTYALAEANPNH